ncbi:MAG: hypothetical protein R2822_17740 [Spirosomataceae bacterium]
MFCLLLVLYHAIAPAVNNRRMAIAQEFNSMYNADLLGLQMFDLTRKDFLYSFRKIYQPSLFFKTEENSIFPKVTHPKKGMELDSIYFEGDILYLHYQKTMYVLPKILMMEPIFSYNLPNIPI